MKYEKTLDNFCTNLVDMPQTSGNSFLSRWINRILSLFSFFMAPVGRTLQALADNHGDCADYTDTTMQQQS